MNAAPKLALVAHQPRTPEDLLAEMVPELLAAEAVVADLRALIAEQGRALARKRGVAFIRPERLRAEFGATSAIAVAGACRAR